MLPQLYAAIEFQSHAQAIALRHNLLLTDALPESGMALTFDDNGLALVTLGRHAPGPVKVDFTSGQAHWRRMHGGGRGQGVARACGLKGGNTPHVLDATAGLGRDAFVLASLGCRVDMIERSPVAAALLEDGLRRAMLVDELHEVVARMHLQIGIASELMSRWQNDIPDVIYLDPMFPEHGRKSALSKKEMQAFQTIIGEDTDADLLLGPAKALARERIVVKRPRHAPWLAEAKPDFTYEGDSVRYDAYRPEK